MATQSTLSYWAAAIRFKGFIVKELYCYRQEMFPAQDFNIFALMYAHCGLFPSFKILTETERREENIEYY